MDRSAQRVFEAILPEDITWRPFPAFPPAVRLAVPVGQPSEPGLYVIRVKVPAGVRLMPHKHPEDRIYTVPSGIFYIGVGDRITRRREESFTRSHEDTKPGRPCTARRGATVARIGFAGCR
jgi:hypothetical protein